MDKQNGMTSRRDFMKSAVIAGAGVAGYSGVQAQAQTQAVPNYAEKLGYPKGARVLMIHADDAGMSHASNEGVIATMNAGTVTSFSTMMPCSWVPGMEPHLQKNPDVCAGLHLTFTAEWDFYRWAPVAGRDAVPGLADAKGFMHDNVGQVVQNATAAEVETELRAQIALAEKMGMPITHMDSHMGTLFATQEFSEVYVRVGIEKQIPILIVGGHGTQMDKEMPGRVKEMRPVAERIWASGLPVLDDLNTASYSWKSIDKKQNFIDLVKNLKPGITWANVHPTKPTEEGRVITGNRELLFGDYYGLLDPAVMQAIKDEGVILTSWKEMHKRRKAV